MSLVKSQREFIWLINNQANNLVQLEGTEKEENMSRKEWEEGKTVCLGEISTICPNMSHLTAKHEEGI